MGLGSLEYGHHSAAPSSHDTMLDQLREEIKSDIADTVGRALRDRTHRMSPSRCPAQSSHNRRSRYDDYYSKYSGDSEYYDDEYEDSYSDYSDRSSRSRSRSVAFSNSKTGDLGAAVADPVPTEDMDPVVNSKSLDVLLAKYAACGPQEEPDPTTAPILDSLAGQLNKWFHGYVAPSEIKRLQEKAELPGNATALKPIKINAELYYAIASDGVQQDKPLSYIGQAITKGCQPLADLWNTLVDADVKYKDANNTPDKDTVLTVFPGLTLNLTKLHDQLSLALMILGNANVQVAQLRRDHFKPYVHYDYHELLRHTNALGENIFGDNLKEKIGDLTKIKQVTRQMKGRKRKRRLPSHRSSRSRGFLGRRGGGGRGHSSRNRGRRGGYSHDCRSQDHRETPQKPRGHSNNK